MYYKHKLHTDVIFIQSTTLVVEGKQWVQHWGLADTVVHDVRQLDVAETQALCLHLILSVTLQQRWAKSRVCVTLVSLYFLLLNTCT